MTRPGSGSSTTTAWRRGPRSTSIATMASWRVGPSGVQQGARVVERIKHENALEQPGGVLESSLIVQQHDRAPATGLPAEKFDLFLGWDARFVWRARWVFADVLQDADVVRAVRRQLEHGMLRFRRRQLAIAARGYSVPARVARRATHRPQRTPAAETF